MTKPHRNPEAALGQRFVPWFMAWAAGVMLAVSAKAQTNDGLDYGDAPMPYPTLKQSNGASHVIKAPVYLGQWVDAEGDGQPGVNATGDDVSPAGAKSDEDGVQILQPLVPGKTVQVSVVAGSKGFLFAWIDFNLDGDWADAGEQIFKGLGLVAGSNTASFVVPSTSKLGSTYARFRFTTSADASYMGALPDGEVEDYRVEIVKDSPKADFGDAPGKYPTTLANNGAWHLLSPGFALGALADGEADGQPALDALGDDNNPVTSDDEDGVTFLEPIIPGSTVKVRITCLVPAGNVGGAYVDAWMDFNANQDWGDPGDQVLVSVPVVNGINDVSIQVPSGAVLGATFARFRISTQGKLAPGGGSEDGEVEDYMVTVQSKPEGLDFGDAPGKYPTLLANNGARHVILAGFYMGGRVDGEPDGQPTLDALGDDKNPTQLDDEDGVVFVGGWVAGQVAKVRVSCVIPAGTVTSGAFVDAWVDFNGNESWADPGENVLVSVPVVAGANEFTFTVPASAKAGSTYARFRLSRKGKLGIGGVAEDGEVEDYQVGIESVPLTLDFGDAPGKYPTLLANDGARHVVLQGFSLGAAVDREADGQQDLSALGDDNNPVIADDEDGVSFTTGLIAGQLATIRVVCAIPSTTTTAMSAFLDAWVDFNGNQSWGDAGDQVFTNKPLVAGANVLTFTVPATATPGTTFARFRLSTKGRLTPGGLADSGEVEDYQIGIDGGTRLLDFGDAPRPYPTLLADDGARHVYDQAYQLGPTIDLEPDGQPEAASLGDDKNPDRLDDEDGVTFLTPLVPGRDAVVRVTTPSKGAFLNAWIDFGQDGSWAEAGDQVVTAYPLMSGVNDIAIVIPANAKLGGTFSRWRLSSVARLDFKGSAINGEVEDHTVRVIPNAERCDLTCDGTDFWLTFPGNYAPDPDNPPVVSLSIQGPPGTVVKVSQPGTGFVANHVIPASGDLLAALPPSAELGELNDVVAPLGVRVQSSAEIAVAGLNHARYSTDSYRALHADVLGRDYFVMSAPNLQSGVEALNGSEFAIVGTANNTVVSITPKVSSGSRVAGVPYSITLHAGEVYQFRATNDAPADLTGTRITANAPVAVFGGHRAANIPTASVWFTDHVVEQMLPVNNWADDFLLARFAGRTGGDWIQVLAAFDATTVSVNGVPVVLNAGEVHSFPMLAPSRIQSSRPVLVAQFALSADADAIATTQGDPLMMLVQGRRHYQSSYRLVVPSADFITNYINVVVPDVGLASMVLDGVPIAPAAFVSIPFSFHSYARLPVGPGVHTVSGAVPFASSIYGWAEYDSYGHPGCYFVGDVQPPQASGTLPPLNLFVGGNNTAGGGTAQVPAAPNTLTYTDNCSPRLDTPVQDPAPGTILKPGTYVLKMSVVDLSGNQSVTTAPLIVDTLPTLSGATNNTINELAPYTQPLAPSDPDVPAQPLTVTLLSGPSGLVVSNAVLAWTPTEAQGPSTNVVRVATSDGIGSVTNQFTLIVREVNASPRFAGATNRTINELVGSTQALVPQDTDVPTQALMVALLSGPTGMVATNGFLAWTPTEAQGPSTNTVSVSVSDGIATVTNSFTVVVREVNVLPTLPGATNATTYVGAAFSRPLGLSDADIPVQTLSLALLQGPAGAALSGGALTWTPTAAQAFTTNTVRVSAGDGVGFVTNTFTVVVLGTNVPPRFAGATNRTINELVGTTQALVPQDTDVPAQPLTVALVSGPTGMVVTNGVLAWTPTEAQGPSTNTVSVSVSDGIATVTNSFTVVVQEVNVLPTLPGATNATTYVGAAFRQPLGLSDVDLPAQVLTAALLQGPAGAALSGGALTWTPTAAQAFTTNTVRVSAGDGVGFVTNTFTVIVLGTNVPPRFAGATNRTINELVGTTQALVPQDTDFPAQPLTVALVSGPTGMVVTNGVLAWTPTEAQGPSTNTVSVSVSDGIATVTNSFVVVVREVNALPTLPGATNATTYVGAAFSRSLGLSDADIPAQALSLALLQGPAGAALSGGALTWTPTAAQAFTTNTVRVSAGDGVGLVTNTFTVIVLGTNVPPRFAGATNTTINERVGYTQALVPQDTDVPAQPLSVALVSGPTGMVLTNGVLAWTPTEAQGPSTNTVSVSVSDGIATVTNSFTVVVREVNALPTLPGATNATLTATVAYVRNLGASDSDVPAQSLTLSLLQGPTGLLVTNGVLAWTPTQLQASTTNTVRVSVSDGVGAVTNSFTLIVTALSGGGASVSSVGGAQLASAMAPGEDAARRILVRRLEASEDSMEVLWMEGHGTLEEAPTPEGPWVPVGATGGLHRVRLEGEARYFRVRW